MALAPKPIPPANSTHSLWERPGATDRLLALWSQERLSSQEIAAVLSVEFGETISKNAVLSKIVRLGKYDEKAMSRRHARSASAEPEMITLPRVGGDYAFGRGRLFRDGVPVERSKAA